MGPRPRFRWSDEIVPILVWLQPVWIGALAGILPGLVVAFAGPLRPNEYDPDRKDYVWAGDPLTGQPRPVHVGREPRPSAAIYMFPLAGAFVGLFVKMFLILNRKRREIGRMPDTPLERPRRRH